MNSCVGAPEQIAAPSISAVMPVHNGSGFIMRTLPPLLAMQRRGEITEVILVDDGSTDDSARIAEELGARVLPSGGRLGPSGARNLAARAAVGEILWFVDADVIAHDDAIAHIVRGLEVPGVVAVFGTYDDRPAAPNFLSQYKNLVHHHYHSHGRAEASTFWAGCGAVRRDAFLRAGGFDADRYPRPSIEDIELGYRLRNAGGRILLLPQLRGTHLKLWRLGDLLHTEIFGRAIPWSRLMLTQTGLLDDLNVSRAERVRAGLAGLCSIALAAALIGWLPAWSLLVLAPVIVLANRELFSLFRRRKGLAFAIAGLAFQQFYYLYSSGAFVVAWTESRLKKLR